MWAAQSRMNRVVGLTLASVLAIGLIGVAYVYGFRKPDYGVLFSNLSPEDASAMTNKLKDDKVPFMLTDGGSTIKVPMDVLYQERVDLAGAGLVKQGGTGFELFDRTNLGMTDFQEKIARLRATEGELQRTIDGLTPVQAARVHIAQPDATLYSSVQAPTTASIAIKTKPGMNLSPSEVKGIASLVSNAVDGLKPENITIVNQDGNVLNTAGADPSSTVAAQAAALQLTQDQLVAKQRYETNLQQNIQSMLDASLGPKRSAVRVATQMDFDANKSDVVSYAPQGTVRSEQTERESYNGTQPVKTPAVGVPGTTTNVVGTYQGIQNQQQSGRYNKSKATRNYEITQQKTSHIDAPGKVTRTSVAVLVNVPSVQPVAATAGAAATADTTYAVSAADVAKIRNVIAAAAGIDPARGDQISVEAVPFNPAVTGEVASRNAASSVLGIPVTALAAIALIALLVGAGAGYALYRRRKGSAAGFHPQMDDLPSFDSSLAEELPPFDEHPMLDGATALAAPIRSAADLTREQMMEYVTTVAQENPDSIAKLVKLWLAE